MGCGLSKESIFPTYSPKRQVKPTKNRRITKSTNQTQINTAENEILSQAKQYIKYEKIEDEDVNYEIASKQEVDDLRSQVLKVQNLDIFEKKIQEIQGQKFTDEEFPPVLKSLTRELQYMPNAKNYKWVRAQEIYPDTSVKIFQGKIEPNDIKQGQLGDCYFLSALACLAERENLIKKLFISKTVNDEGVYGVILCIDGEFSEIIVDDHIPIDKDGKICFSKSNDKDLKQFGFELWVILLEKAYAKIYKGYNQIANGLTGNAIRDLTGAPAVILQCNKGAEEVWDFLQYHESNGHMLTAGTAKLPQQTKQTDTGQGIVSGHAYSILQVKQVQRKGLERIIQLRNPWGQKEWKGDWSDTSSKWTEELKRQLKFTDEDDGIFWIKVEDFVKQFGYVTANYVKESYQYNSMKLKTKKNTSILLKFNVQEDNTHAFIEINQKDQRHFEIKDKYNYSFARILCCRGDFQEWIGDNEGAQRNLTLEGKFNKGTYIAWIDIQNPNINLGADLITVSSYSDKPVQLSEKFEYKSQKELEILDQMLICQPPQEQGAVKVFEQDRNIIRYQGEAGGYIYFQFVNNSSIGSILKAAVQVANKQGLQIMYPYNNTGSFELQLNPKEAKIVKYEVTPKIGATYNYQFKYAEIIQESLDQLVNEAKLQSKGKRIQRQNFKVYVTQYVFKGGCVFYYQNQNKLNYKEEIKFKLNNLKIIQDNKDLGRKNQITVVLKPGQEKYFILQQIDFTKKYSLSTQCSFKLY